MLKKLIFIILVVLIIFESLQYPMPIQVYAATAKTTNKDLYTWQKCQNVFSGDDFQRIVSNGKRTYLFGVNTYFSSDLVNWQNAKPMKNKERLTNIHWCNNQFISLYEDKVFTSKDGVNWTEKRLKKKLKYPYGEMVYGNGRYILVNTYITRGKIVFHQTISYSTDLVNWRTQEFTYYGYYNDIAFNGKCFVIVGNGASTEKDGVIVTSTDGIKWSTVKKDIDKLKDVIWTGKEFICVGGEDEYYGKGSTGVVYSSKDGINWNKICECNIELSFRKVAYNGSTAVAITGDINATESSGIYYSKDFINWTPVETDIRQYPTDVIWTGKKFIVAGKFNTIFTSNDGSKWEVIQAGPSHSWDFEIICNYDKFILVSDKCISVSEDKLKWKRIYDMGISANNTSLVYSNNKYTAIANDRYNNMFDNIAITNDGSGWSTNIIPDTDSLSNLVWDGQQYAFIANEIYTEKRSNRKINKFQYKTFYYSKDGLTWDKKYTNFPIEYYGELIWDGSKYVIFYYNCIYTSVDGEVWERQPIFGEESPCCFREIFKFKNEYYAIGEVNGAPRDEYNVYCSSDLVNWVKVTQVSDRIRSIYQDGSHILLNLGGSSYKEGTIIISKDGREWRETKIPDSNDVYFAYCIDNTAYAYAATSSGYQLYYAIIE